MQHLVCHLRDAEDVLVRLGGQTQHIIELDRVPAAGEGDLAGVEQILLGDVFVDRVAQALAAALDGEGQAALAHLLQPLHDVHREVVRPQGGQGKADAPRLTVVEQAVAKRGQRSVVARGEGEERHVLMPGVFQRLDALAHERLRLLRADRAIDVARLAEAAAAHAAAKELQVHPVVHHLRGGDDGLGRIGHLVQIGDNALGDFRARALGGRDGGDAPVPVIAHLVERGDVHAGNLRGLNQKLVLRPALELRPAQERQKLVVHLFPLAEDEEVDELRHRLRVHRRGAARPHDGQQRLAIPRPEREPRHVDHVEHRRIGHLITHGEGQRIKAPQRIAALQGVERDARLLHLLIHIPPGGKAALAPDEVQAVHRVVEDAHAEVRHTDLVGIGEAEGEADIHLLLVLEDLVIFPARIARGLLHPGQDAFQAFVHGILPSL